MTRATELLDAATPLPWDESSEGRTLRSNIDLLAWAHPADAALIVYAVNRLPAYEAAVEALADMAANFDAAQWSQNLSQRRAWDRATAALARLRDEVPA